MASAPTNSLSVLKGAKLVVEEAMEETSHESNSQHPNRILTSAGNNWDPNAEHNDQVGRSPTSQYNLVEHSPQLQSLKQICRDAGFCSEVHEEAGKLMHRLKDKIKVCSVLSFAELESSSMERGPL